MAILAQNLKKKMICTHCLYYVPVGSVLCPGCSLGPEYFSHPFLGDEMRCQQVRAQLWIEQQDADMIEFLRPFQLKYDPDGKLLTFAHINIKFNHRTPRTATSIWTRTVRSIMKRCRQQQHNNVYENWIASFDLPIGDKRRNYAIDCVRNAKKTLGAYLDQEDIDNPDPDAATIQELVWRYSEYICDESDRLDHKPVQTLTWRAQYE